MATNGSNGSSGEGNTKPPRCPPAKYWVFTFQVGMVPMVPVDLEEVKKELGSMGKYGFGEEVAPTTGQHHLQGWLTLKKKGRPMGCRKLPSLKGAHWEPAKGSQEDNIRYCSKEGKYHTNFTIKVLKDVITERGAYPWQQRIIEITKKEPDDRHIYWFWETIGNTGKTALVRHLKISDPNIIALASGKGSDWACALASIEDPMDISTVIIDLPRTSEGYIPFNMIEQIKNGMVFSGKYESKTLLFNPPHVIIFANFMPSLEEQQKLSTDRWIITQL